MSKPNKDPRERAARALCRFHGNPENAPFEGHPMWMSYLDEVDVVLETVELRSGTDANANDNADDD